MNVDDQVAKAREKLTAFLEAQLIADGDNIARLGATEEERDAFVEYQKRVYDEALEDNLKKIRAWLERDGETLQ
jgi:hypothetical protein